MQLPFSCCFEFNFDGDTCARLSCDEARLFAEDRAPDETRSEVEEAGDADADADEELGASEILKQRPPTSFAPLLQSEPEPAD